MSLDITLAFKYVFEDEAWFKKIAIGTGLSLLFIFFFPVIFLSGYFIRIIRQVKSGDEHKLPEWDNWGELFIDGFKYWLVSFIYMIPVFLLTIIFLTMVFIPAIMAEQTNNDAIFCIFYPCMIIFQILLPAVTVIYTYSVIHAISIILAQTGSIGETLNINNVYRLIRQNLAEIAIISGLVFLAGYIIQIGLLFLVIGLFIASIYVMFIYAHFLGQLARKIYSSN